MPIPPRLTKFRLTVSSFFRKPEWKWNGPVARYTLLGALLSILLSCAVLYIRLSRVVDQQLAVGLFTAATDILAAPRIVAVGDPIAMDQLVQRLQQSGYTPVRNGQSGWFEDQGAAIAIHPGSNSRDGGGAAKIRFAGGRISEIVSLSDNKSRQEYQLDPQLMTNLTETRERRRMVRFADIPQCLVQAVTSVEDKHFFRHSGFDPARVLKALYINVKDGRKQQGASTLTMQLARSLWLDREKTWRRKIEEILITTRLEHKLTKQQIFEYYANEIYLGQRGTFSINGFGEGARAFFGKDLSRIDTAEAALLAGLARRPADYNPFQYPERALRRRNVVLGLMRRNGQLSDQAYRDAAAAPLRIVPDHGEDSTSPYFLALLNNEIRTTLGDDGARNRLVYSTLDLDLQQAAESAVRAGMDNVDKQLGKRSGASPVKPQVALVALNPRTGEIKALVGGRDYRASQMNHVLAMRQPGSAFKPFVYAAAMATALEGGSKVFTPASVVSDEATTFLYGEEEYSPKDFHSDPMGDVTLRTALARSLNVATVSLAEQVGYRRVVAMARRAGLNEGIRPTPAIALGAYETTPLEIAGAYTMFANQGVWVRPTTLRAVRARDGAVLYRHAPDSRAALDPRVAYLMVNLMQEVLRSGTGAGVRSRGFTLPAAGKTGTSRDGWFAGFTSELLCVVWVGFDDNRDLNLEGARSALPIWADFMKRAAQFRPYRSAHDFGRPAGIVSTDICADTGRLAGSNCPTVRSEVFIAGTEPAEVCDHLSLVADGSGGRR